LRPAAQKAESRASGSGASPQPQLRLGSALSPSQLVVGGHQFFAACGAAPVLGWPAAQKAGSRASSKQIGDYAYPLLQPSGGAGDLVLTR
jgi:hypothetical protein